MKSRRGLGWRRWRLVSLVGLIVGGLGPSGPLRAQASLTEPGFPPNLRVVWRAPSECGDRQTLEEQLTAGAGKLAGGAPVRVDALVSRSGDRWHGDLIVEVGAQRTEALLDTESCGDMVSEVVRIAKVALARSASTGDTEPRAAAPRATPQRTAATRAALRDTEELDELDALDALARAEPEDNDSDDVDVEVKLGRSKGSRNPEKNPRDPGSADETPPEETPRTLVTSLGLGFAGGLGILPRFAPGIDGGLSFGGRRLRFDLRVLYLPPQSFEYASDEREGVARLSLFAVGPQACVHFGKRALVAPLCAGFDFGGIRARSADDGESVLPWLAATAGARMILRAQRVIAPTIGVDLSIPVLRQSLGFEEVGPIYRPPVVGWIFRLGLEFRFAFGSSDD